MCRVANRMLERFNDCLGIPKPRYPVTGVVTRGRHHSVDRLRHFVCVLCVPRALALGPRENRLRHRNHARQGASHRSGRQNIVVTSDRATIARTEEKGWLSRRRNHRRRPRSDSPKSVVLNQCGMMPLGSNRRAMGDTHALAAGRSAQRSGREHHGVGDCQNEMSVSAAEQEV